MAFTQKISKGISIDLYTDRSAISGACDFEREFVCPEESMRYARSLEQLVFSKFRNGESPTIIEFGSGTGEPVISAIINAKFSGVVHGYEVNPEASETADQLIHSNGLAKKYIVHSVSFFESQRVPQADYLIANPPYLPCENRDLLILPTLCGGKDGNDVSKRLLSSGYKNVFLEVSSYSDPVAVIDHAKMLGYKISNFLIAPLSFGVYSRQPIIQERLYEMKKDRKAFFSANRYLVGSAFFTKENNAQPDLSNDFLTCLTALV